MEFKTYKTGKEGKEIVDFIAKRIKEQELPGLGIWNQEPAVFYQQAPAADDGSWSSSPYGQVVFHYRMKPKNKKKISGTLQIALVYEESQTASMEQAEQKVRGAFHNVFLTKSGVTLAFKWKKTIPYTAQVTDRQEVGTIERVLHFDIYSFRASGNGSMDPVSALAEWIKIQWPNLKIFHTEWNPEEWRPSGGETALCIQLQKMEKGTFPSTGACTWHTAVLQVHVITEDHKSMDDFSTQFISTLEQKGRFPMKDGSSFFLGECQYDKDADVLFEGQIKIKGQYGILWEDTEKAPLRFVQITDSKEESTK